MPRTAPANAPNTPNDAKQPPNTFRQRLEEALEHFTDAAWLSQHSPLATPYFLGGILKNDRHPHYGKLLQGALLDAAKELPSKQGSYDPQRLLQVAFFQPNLHLTQRGYATVLELSYTTYYRYRAEAIAQLEAIFIRRLHPSLRLEMPHPHPIIGREAMINDCVAALCENQPIAITGASGLGKSTLGAMVAHTWATAQPSPAVFWFTVRLGINDQASSLIFSLGYFLFKWGAPQLWLQLVATGGAVAPELALGLIRQSVATLPQPILLCFDEVDLLRPHDAEPLQRAQLRQLIEALVSRSHAIAPALMIGQQLLIEPQRHITLTGLNPPEIAQLLQHAKVKLDANALAQVYQFTQGNPLLIKLLIALHQLGAPIAQTLQQLRLNCSLNVLLDRIQHRLSPHERDLFWALSVFSQPAPTNAVQALFVGADEALHGLIGRDLAQADDGGGVSLQPALREAVYASLSADMRVSLHLAAANLRAAHGEFTAAAQHYCQANRPDVAVQLWFAQRQHETQHGQAGAALALFRQISRDQLPNEDDRKALALLRAELQQASGNIPHALEDLQAVTWRSDDTLAPSAHKLIANLQSEHGQLDAALESYRRGLKMTHGLLERQAVQFHVEQGRFYYRRQRNPALAWREAQLARYEVEHFLGDAEDDRGNYAEAQQHLHTALTVAQSLDYTFGQARSHASLGTLLFRLNQITQAQSHFAQAITLYTQLGDGVRVQQTRSNVAAMLIQAGRYAEALDPASQALAFFEQAEQPYWVALNASNLAEAHYYLQHWAEAEQFAWRSLREEEDQFRPYALWVMGNVYRAQSQLTAAHNALRDAIQFAQSNADRWAEAPAWRSLGEVLRAQAQPIEAQSAFAAAIALYQALGLVDEVARTQEII